MRVGNGNSQGWLFPKWRAEGVTVERESSTLGPVSKEKGQAHHKNNWKKLSKLEDVFLEIEHAN